MARKKINYAEMYTLRKDGRYQGYWRDADNKRHTICDKDPEKLYFKIIEKEKPKELTFKDIGEAWRDKCWPNLREGTINSYSAAYKRLLASFADTPAEELESSDVYNHLLRMNSKRYSAKTIQVDRTIIKMIYQNAIIDPELGKTVRRNPATDVPLPSKMKPSKRREAPSEDVIQKIRERALEVPFGVYPLLLFLTGMRRGEALALQWQDIDFENKIVRCTKSIIFEADSGRISVPKTDNSIREIVLLDELKQALETIRPKNAKPSHYVFPGDSPDDFIHANAFRVKWMEYCVQMGFATITQELTISPNGRKYTKTTKTTHLTPHQLRHGYATVLFEAGVDVHTAKNQLGHADIETTLKIYTHLREKKKASSIEKLEEYLNKDKS